MNKIMRGIQSYLGKVGFNRLKNSPQFIKRNVMDICVSSAYSIISGYCVVVEKASLLVLLLNGLCMCRIILKNTMEDSRMMTRIKKAANNPNLKLEIEVGKYHYFWKSLVQITAGMLIALCWVIMSFDMSSRMVKALTIVVIGFIFLDDLESMCINMFEADVEFIVSKP